MPYANNKGADSLRIRCLDSIIPVVFISKISSLYLASRAAQAGLRRAWSETPEDKFSHDEAQM